MARSLPTKRNGRWDMQVRLLSYSTVPGRADNYIRAVHYWDEGSWHQPQTLPQPCRAVTLTSSVVTSPRGVVVAFT